MSEKYVIGVDLGGTKISAALSDIEGNIIYQDTLPTEAEKGEEAVLVNILKIVERLLEKTCKKIDDIKSIGIGSPGPLNPKTGIIVETANLPFRNFPIVERVKDELNTPVYLENDANVAAMGEFMFGAGRGSENMIYITVSTGIGVGAILNGKLYRGSTYSAFEGGHTTVRQNGIRCGCGKMNCVESTSSGTGIKKLANRYLEQGVETSLKEYENVTSYEVYVEAEKGDKVAKEVLKEAFYDLGLLVSNLMTLMDPDKIVIGGGVSKIGKVMFDAIDDVVKERCFEVTISNCKIVPSEFGNNSGVVGAVALAIIEENLAIR